MKIISMPTHDVVGGAEETVHVGTRVIAVVYGALGLVQLLLLDGAARWVLPIVSLLSVIVGIECARRLGGASAATLNRMVWLICAIPLVNSLMFMAATGAIAPTMLMLSIVALGAVATGRRHGLVLTVSGVTAWVMVVLATGPHPEGIVVKHAIDIALAAALAFAVFNIRLLISERLRLTELRLVQRLQELDEARRQLEETSTIDPLTSCFNRRGWDDRVQALHRLARRERASMTLAIIDLDRFKEFNDSFGHQAGDELLSSFAQHATAAIRDVDVLARWGGDEFTVALYGCSMDEAAVTFRRIGDAVAPASTCSIGFVQLHADETTSEALARADQALYRAKRGGRAQVAHCTCPTGTDVCAEDAELVSSRSEPLQGV